MANLRTLGVVAAMALGTVGFIACGSGKKTEDKNSTNTAVKQDTIPKQKKDSTTIMPPLTIKEGGDTLVFNSKADSADYQKYNLIAFDNFCRISRKDQEYSDSILNAARKEADSILESERKEWDPKLDEIKEKYEKESEKLEQQYKDGKITFAKLESEKKVLKEKQNNEIENLFSKYTKGGYADRAYALLSTLESRRHEQVDSEAYAKYEKDRDEMRKKYCKEVRPYVSKIEEIKTNYTKGMTIDGVKVKWKSDKDSIAVNNYLTKLFEADEKVNGKIHDQQEKISEQIDQIYGQIDQLEYEANVLYKQGKTKAALNKEEQIQKLEDKISKLEDQISLLDEKCQYEPISIDTINKHSVQKFDKNYKKIEWNF